MTGTLLMMGTDRSSTWVVYNELVAQFGPFPILIENRISRVSLVRTRIKKLGLLDVISQLAFVGLIGPLLRWSSAKRITYLSRRHGLEPTPPVTDLIIRIGNVNSEACRALLGRYAPDVVVVNGTRLIGRKTLSAVKATFINTHQGITPRYRGAHGAYWALFEGRKGDCGVTVHLVDDGIDTGHVIAQALITPEPEDCFFTYPVLQMAAAKAHIVAAVNAALDGAIRSTPVSGDSKVWYHPGFFQYIGGALRGVW